MVRPQSRFKIQQRVYKVYSNSLLDRMTGLCIGRIVGEVCCSCPACCDDVAVTSDEPEELQILVSEGEVGKRSKIRNLYNQVPHLTQDANGDVTNSQLDITNESQEVSPFPAGNHKASINTKTDVHESITNTRQK